MVRTCYMTAADFVPLYSGTHCFSITKQIGHCYLDSPSEQSLQLAWPVWFWYWPGLHSLHERCPVRSWYLPSGHLSHISEPLSLLNSPDKHKPKTYSPTVKIKSLTYWSKAKMLTTVCQTTIAPLNWSCN